MLVCCCCLILKIKCTSNNHDTVKVVLSCAVSSAKVFVCVLKDPTRRSDVI